MILTLYKQTAITAIHAEKEVKQVEKIKEMHIVFKRINFNRFIVQGKVMNYLELVNWFRDIVTE